MNGICVLSCGISDGNPDVNSIADSEWTVVWSALGIQRHVPLKIYISRFTQIYIGACYSSRLFYLLFKAWFNLVCCLFVNACLGYSICMLLVYDVFV